MRNLNLDPFWRTSVGFDRLFDLMDESLRFEPEDNYPPCNIVRTGEDKYRISLAVAGFKPEQISVMVHENTLTIAGRINEKQDQTEYLHRGIAGRPFERRFNLADFVEVKRASFEDGLLQIELEREVPESMKPRKVEIQVGQPSAVGRQDEDDRAQQGCLASRSSDQGRWFGTLTRTTCLTDFRHRNAIGGVRILEQRLFVWIHACTAARRAQRRPRSAGTVQ